MNIFQKKKNIVVKEKPKVVIDCGNGASGCIAPNYIQNWVVML